MIIPRRLAAFLLAVVTMVLAIIVLVSHPTDELDLLAGACLGAGLGIVLVVGPD